MAFQKFLLNGGLVLITAITTITAVSRALPYIVPREYDVKIQFRTEDFKNNIIVGRCDIVMSIYHALRSIMLYSAPINITDVFLINNEGKMNSPISTPFNKEKNILTLRFSTEIVPDLYNLTIVYESIQNENITSAFGLLRDSTLTQTGDVEVLKASQLFPCKDEIIKSRFQISINHYKLYTVLSNMPVRAQYRDNTDDMMIWSEFDPSFLSAGNIAVVITTFTSISFGNVTIWCRQSILKHVLYAAKVVRKIVPMFKEIYFQQELQFLKLDIIALWNFPDDLNITTFGLVLLREADITYDKNFDSSIRKREIAHIIARQFAFHWCEDILFWAKEGFAIFFGAYVLDEIYQNDHIMDLMVVQTQLDSLRYETPISRDFLPLDDTRTSQEEINLFEYPINDIKSFIIWRILYHLTTPGLFWDGIRTYIDMQRSSTIPLEDLCSFIGRNLKDAFFNLFLIYNPIPSRIDEWENNVFNIITLRQMMYNWMSTKYYPVLNVTKNYKSSMIIYNLPFNLHNDIPIWIPVTYTMQSFSNYSYLFWLTVQRQSRTFSDIDSNDWVIVNVQQIGYYRVNYDCQNWNKLMLYLNSENYTKIHILNRAQIIDDAFYFLLKKELGYNMFWNLTNFLLYDTNYVTWYSMIKVFESMTCIFSFQHNTDIMTKIKNRVDRLLTEIEYFGRSNKDYTPITYLRQEAIKWACTLGVPKCQEIAASELNKELQNSVENNNLVGKKWIYCHGLMMTTNYTIWHLIWQKWTVTFDERFLEYLTCVKDSTLICYHLALMVKAVQTNEQTNKHVNIFFLIITKHAENNNVLSFIFENLESFRFSSNRKNDIIATLIVIITHMQVDFRKIINFAMQYEKQIATAVKTKVEKRQMEYGKLIQNFEYYFNSTKCEKS